MIFEYYLRLSVIKNVISLDSSLKYSKFPTLNMGKEFNIVKLNKIFIDITIPKVSDKTKQKVKKKN
jgi:hypothetical protein